jgi:decaprenylphospho-beta-D-erythro-pentofuranosid-2-ulose 2-reductase
MKKILIIGATSAIAEATARHWAQQGHRLYLIARDAERLTQIAADLKIRGAESTYFGLLDVNNFEQHENALDLAIKKLDGIDVVLIAHGTLPNQKECQTSVTQMLDEIKTNGTSVIALLTRIGTIFEQQGHGTVAAITSVAGDRGRASNYVYGSAKAMVTTFMSGLRQRLYSSGIAVVTIKPGFVDTPMTAEFKKGVLWAKPEAVALRIVQHCEGKGGEFYVPGFWWGIMGVIKGLPERLFVRIKI